MKSLGAPGRYFADKQNLALVLNTDGVPLYKSSLVSIWPVYIAILNLPAHLRMNSENIILCGLWVGPGKPSMDLLLRPVCSNLQHISSVGLTIQTPLGEEVYRAKLVMGIFDLPAKAAVLHAKQYNGEYGCSVCLHPGKRLPNNARVYLPRVHPERTHEQVMAYGVEAERESSCIKGVLGISPLSSVLDLVASIPIDYMHNVLEGVTRWLTRAWFESKNHSKCFYIGRHVRKIDALLLKVRPPSEFSRPPRSIHKHFKYWKASELHYWLLYYSLPLLMEFLPSL